MRSHLGIATMTSILATLAVVTPPAHAGSFGVSISTGGFGVSVGYGDWGPYTNNWANPYWSLDFNATLSGYGEWVSVGGLGTVWRPWVAVGWQPYSYGRWVFTNFGWTWVAYEPWGYIPHHYGSWAMADFGWVWVPGYTYSCANVVWVRSGGYVGWYARPPYGWSHAARGYSRGYRDGYRDGWNDARYANYVDWHDFGSDDVSQYAVRHTVASRGQVQDHAAPPSADEVRRRGGVAVPEARMSQRTVTMNGHQVTVARPDGVAPSIERHASRTAAAALAPAALERRQPLVRAGGSASPVATSAENDRRVLPTDRAPVAADRTRSTGRPELNGSASTVERRVNAQPGPVAERVTGGRIGRDPVDATPVGLWRDSRSQRSARPGSADRSSATTLSHPVPDASRGGDAAVPARRMSPVAVRNLPAADRSRQSSGSSATGTTGRLAGVPSASRHTVSRPTAGAGSPRAQVSESPRQTPRRIEAKTESTEQQPGRSRTIRKP
jgi:hypothetical protein